MSDSLTSLYLTNPQLAVALRQQSMAMPYIQAGIDSSPIRSPLQGLGRLADALVGRVLYNRGNDQIQSAISNQQAAQQQNDADYQRVLAGALTGQQPPAAPQPPPQAEGVPATPRAANNPLNMRYAGQDGAMNTGGFAAFPTPEAGQAATDKQFSLYADRGINSIRGLVSRWAPPSENNTDAYIGTVSKLTGIDPDAKIDLTNPAVTGPIQAAMARVEANPNGHVQLAQAGNVMTDATPGQGNAMPPTGMDSPNVAQAMRMMQTATQIEMRSPYDPKAKIQAAGLRQQAQAIMGMDSFQTLPDGTIVNLRTGQRMSAPTPAANYQPDPNNPGVYTSPGQKPVFAPSPRVFQTPAGAVGAVGSGGQITSIAAPDNAGIAARKLAEAQAGTAGKDVPTVKQMAEIGANANAAMTNIDQGVKALQDASANGIQSGYFAPWIATAAAAGKNLGIDMSGLGINPQAVGNAQVAQKTLGIVAGAILQKTLGKDSAITDAKIEHFIHTQPGLETDPQALQHIMQWARSQFLFEHNMSMSAMDAASKNNGIIPPTWEPGYYKAMGSFGPIYNPINREVVQPNGQGPAPNLPQAQPAAPQQPQAPRQPTRAELEAEMRKRGLLK